MKAFEQTPLVEGEAIKTYIPQREPIIMVDRFYGINDTESYSGLRIAADNLFVENGRFIEPGVMEHIAQSCALRAGYLFRSQGKAVPVGYIGAVKQLKFLRLPLVGQELQTTVRIVQEVFGITLVEAEVRENRELIASCEMKIFIGDTDNEKKEES